MRAIRVFLRKIDKALVISTVLLFLIGLSFLYSTTYQRELVFLEKYTIRQLAWFIVGLILAGVLLKINYIRFIDFSYPLYFLTILMLLLVLLVGDIILGAQRWLEVGGFAFQPSEFAKIVIIIVLANYLGKNRLRMYSIKTITFSFILISVPMFLILKQPDLGTAITLFAILFSMLFVSGIKIKHLAAITGIGISALPILWHFLKPYQKSRLLVFLNPNLDPLGAGYTIRQSKIAVGSGMLLGKGWQSGTQNILNFLPERHTDFIFSVVGEEVGFIGALCVLLLFFIIIKQGIKIAYSTNDIYGRLLAVGIVSMIIFHIFVNISMTIGLMPVVGIPLPLISYGGSSLVITLIAISILLNIKINRPIF
ncbi:MAG: rod shape-determining protein RodA [Candidatus Omnitrophica bacterium]|nr:rod shape-determining protein RodA [Candidatus Omnitrophota bacterium]